MTSQPFKLNSADWQMADEMYQASPDGQAEQARIRELIAGLPDGSIEINGFLDVPDEDRP